MQARKVAEHVPQPKHDAKTCCHKLLHQTHTVGLLQHIPYCDQVLSVANSCESHASSSGPDGKKSAMNRCNIMPMMCATTHTYTRNASNTCYFTGHKCQKLGLHTPHMPCSKHCEPCGPTSCRPSSQTV